jgi:uncharacterized Zn-binding protein involved in type VI secretion
MMKRVMRSGDFASCGCAGSPGSADVWINGRRVLCTGTHAAGGTIVGPGADRVLVNGQPISVNGDGVAGHDKSPHDHPTTVGGSPDVLAFSTGAAGASTSGATPMSLEEKYGEEGELVAGRLGGGPPSAQALLEKLDRLRERYKAGRPFTPEERRQFLLRLRYAPAFYRTHLNNVLNSLELFASGKINSHQYFSSVLQSALKLARPWGLIGSRNTVYFHLISLAFTQPYWSTGRALTQSFYDPAGALVEMVYSGLVQQPLRPAAGGFHPFLEDREDPTSTVTHHWRELTVIGAANRGLLHALPAAAQEYLDSEYGENYADYQVGNFASQTAAALVKGRITLEEFTRVTIWATSAGPHRPWTYQADRNKPSPDFFDRAIHMYNRAHPTQQIFPRR